MLFRSGISTTSRYVSEVRLGKKIPALEFYEVLIETLEEIRVLLTELYQKKIQELKNRKVFFGYASKTMLLKTQSKLMNELKRTRDLNKMAAVSVCSQAIKLSHAIELLETQTLSSFINYLRDLFEQASSGKQKTP